MGKLVKELCTVTVHHQIAQCRRRVQCAYMYTHTQNQTGHHVGYEFGVYDKDTMSITGWLAAIRVKSEVELTGGSWYPGG